MMHRIMLALAAILVVASSPAGAQDAQAQWKQTLEKAKGQTLVILHQGITQAFDATLQEFSKKYGIKVDATYNRPSQALPRIRTEQQNGQYLWDVWWAITANMAQVAAPAGMFQPFEPFLILPEVKDPANWRHPDYLYGDSGRTVFTYSHEVSYSAYVNEDNLGGVKLDKVDALMDPKLKGKIVARDASVPNAGSFALSPIYKAKGGDFLLNMLKAQNPRVYENPEQLDTAIMRGGAAIALGVQSGSFAQCKLDGGCKKIEHIEFLPTAVSRGFGVLKNAPHPEAAKVFLNWVLSKEGQAFLVNEWVKDNATGAVSMRKDVEPHPKHADNMPDFTNPEKYVWVSSQKGEDEVKAVNKIFKEWTGK